MKLKSTALPFLLIFAVTQSFFAQKRTIEKVQPHELAASVHALDSLAEASVIFSTGKVSFTYVEDWWYVYEVRKRIKIYNEDAYDLATVRIPYYVGSNRNSTESVNKIKATTYHLDGDKISTTKIKRSDITEEEINDFYRYKVFTLPDVKEGSIIEYSYQIVSPFIDAIPQWFFQEDIPVDFSSFYVEIPEFLAYEEYATGFHEIKREVSEKEDKFSFMFEEGGTLAPDMIETATTNIGSLNIPVRFIYFETENLPKIESNNFVHNIRNYLSSVKLEQVGSRNPDDTRYEFGSLNWDDVVRIMIQSPNFGGELKHNKFLRDDVRNLTKEISTPQAKAEVILQYLQDRMTWDGYFGVYASKELSKVYNEKIGNVADINLLQTIMMRLAGIDAYPLILSTRDHGIPVAPSVNGMNYVVTAAKFGNDYVLFDASDKYSSPNLLDEKTLNWFGRLIQDNGVSHQIDLLPKVSSSEIINLHVTIEESGMATGILRRHLTNYEAINNRKIFTESNYNFYLDDLEDKYSGIQIFDHFFMNLTKNGKPLVESFSFEVPDVVLEKNEENYFFNPMLFLAMQSHSLNVEERSYPIDFSYPKAERFIITVDLPASFEVQQVPKDTSIALPNGLGYYHYLATGKGNQIQLNVRTEINTTFLNANYFPYLKEFFNQIVSKETEYVLVKKNN